MSEVTSPDNADLELLEEAAEEAVPKGSLLGHRLGIDTEGMEGSQTGPEQLSCDVGPTPTGCRL